ncbi:unnamed protein product [Didymodactylos carnosus]|uniref:Cytochrome P450 n=1 Tax=Didymodactylos carnosus TaxID=1234261 RepID=A0A814Q3E5_9BILA|nr:unnamed protein product [Didymodactylos carnosus]CAF1132524.1 unnamed protein product [Didymodactylos carnosus]CAF3877923.1 unnamed protein product [Didymodactylos carnosus]CAF3917302.1 unnamed protein product [Didymodactylos carnosus]
MLPIILLTIFLCLVLTYVLIILNRYKYFSLQEIPGPRPQFFFGNFNTLWNAEFPSRQLQTWTKQFGQIYGIYEGTTPTYVVSNVNFLQEVLIKQFSNFHARKVAVRTTNAQLVNLFNSDGARWKRQRYVINPTFSALKLKQMSPLINDCINQLMTKLPTYANENEEFNIYELYKRMTMDVICRCAFGIDTDMQNDPDNIYLKKAYKVFATDTRKRPVAKLSVLIPSLNSLFIKLFLLQNNLKHFINQVFPSSIKYIEEFPTLWLGNRIHEVIEMRSKGAKQRVDLLQLMLEAATRNEIKEETSKKNVVDDEGVIAKVLTYNEVKNNVVVFMLAGYETTSTALAYCTYILANHSDVQQKLQDEIDQYIVDDDQQNPDYDIVNRMDYMDMFIKEVLRMHPIAPRAINRECIKDTIVCGYKIPKGSVIQPDVYSIHYDPDLWGPVDPEKFHPERHSTKRHPLCYLPFGSGPRNCVGMRFALTEMKILLTRLLKQYTIVKCDKLEEKLNIRQITVIAPEAIWVKLEKRNR